MRNALRSFLRWLDTRFPEKVIVTAADFEFIKGQIVTAEKLLQQHEEYVKKQAARIERMEAEITKFNVHFGFAGVSGRLQAGPFQR